MLKSNEINYEIIKILKSIPGSVTGERPTHRRSTQFQDYLGRAGTLEGSLPLQLEVPRCHHQLRGHSVSCDSISQVSKKKMHSRGDSRFHISSVLFDGGPP